MCALAGIVVCSPQELGFAAASSAGPNAGLLSEAAQCPVFDVPSHDWLNKKQRGVALWGLEERGEQEANPGKLWCSIYVAQAPACSNPSLYSPRSHACLLLGMLLHLSPVFITNSKHQIT